MSRPDLDRLNELLSALSGSHPRNSSEGSEEKPPIQRAAKVAQLKERFEHLQIKHTFKEGDILEWKPGMRNRSSTGPYVVTGVLDKPIPASTQDVTSSAYSDVLDLKLGHIDNDGDLIEFHYDSRRFQPYSGPTLDSLND